MRIVYTCSYAHPSISGVWTRVENLAHYMVKQGHEIHILTSNFLAGSDKTLPHYENYKGIHIHRFPVKVRLTKYQLVFTGRTFTHLLQKIQPDIIDCQTFRHPEGKAALKYAQKNNIPCIITTHACFLPVEVRGRKLSLLADLYDLCIGKRLIQKYTRIFRISHWEQKFLKKLGADPAKIIYSPNGVPHEFFETPLKKVRSKRILFLGRVEPRKQVHILIEAFAHIAKKHPTAILDIVGPIENSKGYETRLKDIIRGYGLEKKVQLHGPIYDLDKKITIINNSHLYVLPSTWEGFPQSLIEAMSLQKCIIGSDCDGNRETLEEGETGFLFRIGNISELAHKLDKALTEDTTHVEKNARRCAEQFRWETIAKNVESVYQSLIRNN